MLFRSTIFLVALSGLDLVQANYCYGKLLSLNGVATSWLIDVAKDNVYNTACGNGCLDNIRGRCGAIEAWGCTRNADGGAHYSFLSPGYCSADDMNNAMLACTRNEQHMGCNVGW